MADSVGSARGSTRIIRDNKRQILSEKYLRQTPRAPLRLSCSMSACHILGTGICIKYNKLGNKSRNNTKNVSIDKCSYL